MHPSSFYIALCFGLMLKIVLSSIEQVNVVADFMHELPSKEVFLYL